jgi:hypothetical protein
MPTWTFEIYLKEFEILNALGPLFPQLLIIVYLQK